MKTKRTTTTNSYASISFFNVMICLLLMSFVACSTDDDPALTVEEEVPQNKISFIIKGGDFATELVEFTDYFEPNMRAGYEDATQSTVLQATGVWKNEVSSIIVHFPSNGVGLFLFRAENGNDFFPTQSEDIFISIGDSQLFIKGATLEIEEYGAGVGDYIKGNFFGTWDDPITQEVITINQGEFEFLRTF